MRRKGFTLVELLVVIAIIAMLLAILMPALAKVKTLAYQMLCGTNLKGIANAILVYGQDNNEKYPVAGNPSNPAAGTGVPGIPVSWRRNNNAPQGSLRGGSDGNNWQWDDPDRSVPNCRATVSACLYLLVKYADVSPASFVCKASSKQKKLNLPNIQALAAGDTSELGVQNTDTSRRAKDATDCWDFSNIPSRYCSYAYAYPWDTSRQLSSSSKSGMAVAADLNPWIQGEAPGAMTIGVVGTTSTEAPQMITFTNKLTWLAGNSPTHEQVGQNILFNDMHVEFSKQPNPDSAVQNDNVYTTFDATLLSQTNNPNAVLAGRQRGLRPENTGLSDAKFRPYSKDDSYLVQW